MSGRRGWNNVIFYAVVVAATVVVLFPLYWMVTTSLKLPVEIYRKVALWPSTIDLGNYAGILADRGFLRSVGNSFVVSSSVTLLSLIVSAPAAYALTRYEFHGRRLMGRLVLFTYLTPVALLFIPLSIIVSQLKLSDTLTGLIIVYIGLAVPLGTWMLQDHFRAVPREIEEQALLDGLGPLGVFVRIVVPLSAPGIAAVGILMFTMSWNELLLAMVLTNSDAAKTVPYALSSLIVGDSLPWGGLMAGACIASAPLVIFYFVSQRFIAADLASGAVKG